MNQDIISLLHDLGKDNAVDIISNYILINPDAEGLIANKMGSILTASEISEQPQTANEDNPTSHNSPATSGLSGLFNFSGFCSLKMIFVVNMDLNMGRGKQCAQVAHAALGLYLHIQELNNPDLLVKVQQWIISGQKKIVVKANGLDHLKDLQKKARESNISNYLVSDAGCTQIAPGSKTVLGLFGTSEELDKITGTLKLL